MTRMKISLVLLLAVAVAAFPIGCASEFTSCEDTLTCDNSAGEGGDTGDGRAGASSGAGGTDDAGGGQAGDASGAALQVVDVTPADGDVDVERLPEIGVTFSEAIDPSSLTSASVTLEGPEGSIELDIDVEGVLVTAVPAAPLSLLGDYTLTVASVTSEGGASLTEDFKVGFEVRDGIWGDVQRLDTSASHFNAETSNSGHMVAIWATPASYTVKAAVFDPLMAVWTSVHVLEEASGAIRQLNLSTHPRGDVVAHWQRTTAESNRLARFDALRGWGPAVPDAIARDIAIAPDRSLVGVWRDDTQGVFYSATDNSGAWLEPRLWRADASPLRILPLTNSVFLLHTLVGSSGLWGAEFTGEEWSGSPSLGGGRDADTYTLTTSPAGLALVAGTDEQGGGAWIAEVESGAARVVELDTGVCFFAEVVFNLANQGIATWMKPPVARAALRTSDGTWGSAEDIGPIPEQFFMGPRAGIDAQGNALMVWASEDEFLFQRWIVGRGWQPLTPLEFGPGASPRIVTLAPGDSAMIWTNATGVWTARFM